MRKKGGCRVSLTRYRLSSFPLYPCQNNDVFLCLKFDGILNLKNIFRKDIDKSISI